ncbi:MAG: N-acetyltransferase [Actinomycetia bacterium]|nr:N-acetyltransferase [Actinomycetes bacterium]
MEIRAARLADAEAIMEIYNHQVLTATVTFDTVPRTVEDQQAWITGRSGAYPAIVAVNDDNTVVGFGSLSRWRTKPAYSTSAENSVYVHHDHHGHGIGSILLGSLVERATEHGFHAVFARIVGGHEASIALHHRHGYQQVGLEREVGRKFGRWLDVVLMERLLS